MNLAAAPVPRSAGALERLFASRAEGVRLVGADASVRVTGLVDDSREAAPGTAFFARVTYGVQSVGHQVQQHLTQLGVVCINFWQAVGKV